MSKNGKELKAGKMNSISAKYVEDHELRDVPARLFRMICNKMEMNPTWWAKYMRNFLEYVVTTEDREKAKAERITRTGNAKDTFWQKPTLTFNKLLEGLSILRMKKCTITLTIEDEHGKTITVSDTIQIMTKDRLNNKIDADK